ncbi:hypothetical protein H7H37_15095, partial [Mycolicibacterium insubricum]|nr:hypothetical protein [Mycolicibacterium insubricum]
MTIGIAIAGMPPPQQKSAQLGPWSFYAVEIAPWSIIVYLIGVVVLLVAA